MSYQKLKAQIQLFGSNQAKHNYLEKKLGRSSSYIYRLLSFDYSENSEFVGYIQDLIGLSAYQADLNDCTVSNTPIFKALTEWGESLRSFPKPMGIDDAHKFQIRIRELESMYTKVYNEQNQEKLNKMQDEDLKV